MCAPIVAEVGLSARTHETGGTARTLAGSVRYDQINYTGIGELAYFCRQLAADEPVAEIAKLASISAAGSPLWRTILSLPDLHSGALAVWGKVIGRVEGPADGDRGVPSPDETI